jgi:fucose 4-O-acetylase-like acetyltransferase
MSSKSIGYRQIGSISAIAPSRNIHHSFVDIIRVFGIAGIIWAHVPIFAPVDFTPLRFDYKSLYFPFMLFWKFGVINFFMISGYLLKGKLEADPFAYLKRRLIVVGKPYLIALTIFTLPYGYHVWRELNVDTSLTSSICYLINKIVLSTSFWFIPSYFVSLTIIVLTRRYIKNFVYGATLFLITLSVAILSVYFPSVSIPHLDILIGYTFFLWLGYTLNNNILIDKILTKSNFFPLTILAVLGLAVSCVESYKLCAGQYSTYFHILRPSNIAYSVVMFMLMMHLFNGIVTPNMLLKLKSNSFELYLYHPLFAWVIAPKTGLILQDLFDISSFTYSFRYFSINFIITYLFIFIGSYLLVTTLKRSKRLRWAFVKHGSS